MSNFNYEAITQDVSSENIDGASMSGSFTSTGGTRRYVSYTPLRRRGGFVYGQNWIRFTNCATFNYSQAATSLEKV